MDIQGKKALVTGGAVRIGATICRSLSAAGAEVIIHCRRSMEAAQSLRDELTSRGGAAHVVHADLTSEEACVELLDQSIESAGGLDILVNNAAVFSRDTLRTITLDSLMAEWWPNLLAPLFLLQGFAERVKSGKVVNLLDRRITSLDTSCAPYLLSKKSLAEITRLAALEYAPDITVNGVAPGPVLPPPGEGEEYLVEKAGFIPLGGRVPEEEIARAVMYLLDQDCVTGQILFVDGGQHLSE